MQQSGVFTPQSEVYTVPSTDLTPDNRRKLVVSGIDAVAGAVGGVVSVLLGQPFDLIRVRLQTSNSSNVLKITRDIWVHEGTLAFYKGAAAPFIGSGICVSIQFAVFHSLWQAFEHDGRSELAKAYLFGGAAGAANSILSSPVEHIRTRLQLQPHGAARLYAGPVDCMRSIIRQTGVRGIFKAFPVAFVKEAQAFGCYFLAFEASITRLSKVRGRLRNDMSAWEIIPCGALGGIGFWVGSFPLDVIKTRLQGDAFGADAQYKSTRMAVVKTWREGGMKAFWRGLSPTLVRTSLSSAGCFTAVEQIRKLMAEPQQPEAL